jgi:8-amino-7-oxononanoate synthase
VLRWQRALQSRTRGLQQQARWREPDASPRVQPQPEVDGETSPAIDVTSNDYLGLAAGATAGPRSAAAEWVDRAALGAGSARLVRGTHPEHRELEGELARWLGYEESLIFSSGYAANVGLISALAEPGDVVVSDALNHASIIDGCRLSRAAVRVVAHRDLGALEREVAEAAAQERVCWVVSESYFSMDGNGPDLAPLARVCREHEAALLVDESHALGVFGPEGRGLCSVSGFLPDVMVSGLGKAFGAQGGFVASSAAVRGWLWNRARSFVFSTGVSPRLSAALREQLRRVRGAEGERRHLAMLGWTLREHLQAAGLCLPAGQHGPLVPVIVGSERRALDAAAALRSAGFHVQPIRPPTVPVGESRLRISLHAGLRLAEVEALAAAVVRVLGGSAKGGGAAGADPAGGEGPPAADPVAGAGAEQANPERGVEGVGGADVASVWAGPLGVSGAGEGPRAAAGDDASTGIGRAAPGQREGKRASPSSPSAPGALPGAELVRSESPRASRGLVGLERGRRRSGAADITGPDGGAGADERHELSGRVPLEAVAWASGVSRETPGLKGTAWAGEWDGCRDAPRSAGAVLLAPVPNAALVSRETPELEGAAAGDGGPDSALGAHDEAARVGPRGTEELLGRATGTALHARSPMGRARMRTVFDEAGGGATSEGARAEGIGGVRPRAGEAAGGDPLAGKASDGDPSGAALHGRVASDTAPSGGQPRAADRELAWQVSDRGGAWEGAAGADVRAAGFVHAGGLGPSREVWPAAPERVGDRASVAGARDSTAGDERPSGRRSAATQARRWVVLGAGTGVGKTFVAAGLARALAREGRPVGALKPIESGLGTIVQDGGPAPGGTDAAELEQASFHVKHPPQHPLFGLKAPLTPALAARREGTRIDLTRVEPWLAELVGSDGTPVAHLVIETAGGVFSPLSGAETNLDLAERLEPATWILVAADRLGVLHELGATLRALAAVARLPDWVVLSAPAVADDSTGTNAAELAALALGVPIVALGRAEHEPLLALMHDPSSP